MIYTQENFEKENKETPFWVCVVQEAYQMILIMKPVNDVLEYDSTCQL